MTRALPILTLAFLSACSTPSTRPERAAPVPAELEAALSAPCAALPPLENRSRAEIATKDNDLAALYWICAQRHAGAVNAYQAARDAAMRWNEGKD